MIPLGQAPEQPTQDEILAFMKDSLQGMLTTNVRGEVQAEKTSQNAMVRRNHFYHQGKQYLTPMFISDQVVDYSPVGIVRGEKWGEEQYRRPYANVMNTMRGDARKFVAVLGQRMPTVKAMPDRLDDETSIRRARRADHEARKLFFSWDCERNQRNLALGLWKTTTMFGFMDWVADGKKYGWIEEPQYENQPVETVPASYRCFNCGTETEANQVQTGVCPSCGTPFSAANYQPPVHEMVPQVVDVKKYPKGAVEFQLADVTKITTPFYVEDVLQLPWLLYEYETHTGVIMQAMLAGLEGEELKATRDKMKSILQRTSGGDSTSTQGTLLREQFSSPTSTPIGTRRDRGLFGRLWIDPCMYEMLVDDDRRDLMYAQFPEGARLTLVNDEIVKIDGDKLTKHWMCCKPDTSEYIYCDPQCEDFIHVQNLVNTFTNIAEETFERGVPWFLANPQVIDMAQMRKHALHPAEMIPALKGSAENAIWKAPTADMNPQVGMWLKDMVQSGRDMTGIQPSIFGGGEALPTARQEEMRRNQALMQLGSVWAEMRRFWSGCYSLGVKLLAEYGAAQEQADRELAEEQLAMVSELAEGGYHFEAAEAMPMTWAQMRDFYMFLLDKGPEIWQKFGLFDSKNLPVVQAVLGMDNWQVPGLSARDKVYDVIAKLLKGKPQHNPQTGQVEPSIPIDVWEDDHTLSATIVKDWAQESGRIARDNNPDGYDNVIAWGMAHLQLTLPDPNAPGAAPPPDGGAPDAQGAPLGRPREGKAGPPPGAPAEITGNSEQKQLNLPQ